MRFDALQITQPSGKQVYAFATTADAILRIADILRIGRGTGDKLVGYQRPEALNHVSEIRRYIEGDDSVLPNTIVIAFDDIVKFTPYLNTNKKSRGPGVYGSLEVPDGKDAKEHHGFIVDGQQRLAAIASSRYSDFPVFATAIVAPGLREQRKQFILVNRTKPLPSGMVFELLPEIDGVLPKPLSRQRLAATITTRLNLQIESSLYHKIKTPTCPTGYIKDNSIRRVVLNSLSDGALFNLLQQEVDESKFSEAAVSFISKYWKGVSLTFGEAFEVPPQRSRLTHGVGIVAMGYVMDHIHSKMSQKKRWTVALVASELKPLKKYCAWMEGYWEFNGSVKRRWNELENTDKDIRLLTQHLRRLLQQPSLPGLV